MTASRVASGAELACLSIAKLDNLDVAKRKNRKKKKTDHQVSRKVFISYLRSHGLVDGSPPVVKFQLASDHFLQETSTNVDRCVCDAYQMSFSDDSSLTTLLSEGERPVLAPE